MIASRRWPNATPPSMCSPVASGPRWAICASIRRRTASSSDFGRAGSRVNPTMPHTARLSVEVQRLAHDIGALVAALVISAHLDFGDDAEEEAEQGRDRQQHDEEWQRCLDEGRPF